MPRAHRPASSARGHARQPQRNASVQRTNPPQFAQVSQNVAAMAMLLHDLPEPNNPRGRAIHQNLRALLETAAVQQAEYSVLRLVTSHPVRGTGTQQIGHHTLSSPQPPIAAQGAATAPHLDLTTTLYRPPIYAWLGPNQDARSVYRGSSPNSLEPRTFVQHPQQAPFLPRFNEGRDKGKAKRQDQDEGPST